MSEMVERVARALLKAHYERGRGIPPDYDALDRFERGMWEFSARAAIEAMRQPTVAMVEAGMPWIEANDAPSASDGTRKAYQAMLAAALTKQP